MQYIELSIATNHSGRQYYTYSTTETVAVGTIVKLSFGRKQALGIVRGVVKKPTFSTKTITQVLPFTLPQKSLKLLAWLEAFYPYDYGDLTSLFLPPNTLVNPRKALDTTPPTNTTQPLPPLTNDQKQALQNIGKNKHALLHGTTGSGKTRVFLELAKEVLATGKSVLILTPEIGLTPQLEKYIAKHLPYPVYVTHSQNTLAQRRRVWDQAMGSSFPAIFVGPRSSLFLPYQSLGLIVADESHDNSYKNMKSPRYNGVYVASRLAQIHKATFLQSTATPNTSDYVICQKKNIPTPRMTQTAAGQQKVTGQIVDINDKKKFTKNKYLSDVLIDSINAALAANQQTMLFINRRGSARVVQCNKCGHTEECPTCGIPVTYHHDSHSLKCHLCGYSSSATAQCSSCGSPDLLFFAPGTKGIEQELETLFPSAKIARFDLDVSAKDTLHRRMGELKDGSVDIIIGTQVISKGLDLPKLSVVGVLNADSTIQMPDYRAEEVGFQQLYQVTGRVGRGHTKSKFFIQTRQPEHPVIQAALARSWDEFYVYERHKRSQFDYPPFKHVALLKTIKAKSKTAENTANKLAKLLEPVKNIEVLGPSPSYHELTNGKYSWQIIIKSSSRASLLRAAKQASADWIIDMDPLSLL